MNHSLFNATPSCPIFFTHRMFLMNFVFPHFWFCVDFCKYLRKVSLYKGILKFQSFILTPSQFTRTRRHVFLSHPTQAYLSIQTFSALCDGPFGPARPYGCFLFNVIAHMGLLVHTDVSFSLSRLIQTNSPR